ncbi:PREDICTED: uncharacterized protein LOC107187061 [Dufourea novaeangliae]|uniref:uncharacterized protein LOC107187061 n=1 Tax=Dufourea novaeangliae TaxID=178035 RepID=UPI000767DAD5|nr:PREDICTED: uncharacterized protein LOC107187061 [Dufourea novaeangliae]
MKLALFALLATGCLIAVARSEEEYDYEEEAAAPVTPVAPARPTPGRLGGLLSSRGRVPAGRKGPATTQSTTAKPVEQPVEVEEEGEEELDENAEQQEEVQTTTTESSKIVRGGIRPFRSNQDLLAALKRRRAQVPSHRDTTSPSSPGESTTPKAKASTSNRAKSSTPTDAKSAGRSRFGGSRGKQVQEEVEETQREEVQVKAKPYRRG